MSRAKGRKKRAPRIIWSAGARADLAGIGDYIATDNPVAAERWIEKLLAIVEQAGQVPMAGRIVPEFKRTDLRERVLRHYRVVYRLVDEQIEIVTIFEGHRQVPLDALPDEE